MDITIFCLRGRQRIFKHGYRKICPSPEAHDPRSEPPALTDPSKKKGSLFGLRMIKHRIKLERRTNSRTLACRRWKYKLRDQKHILGTPFVTHFHSHANTRHPRSCAIVSLIDFATLPFLIRD
jgi:hypothetical protein